MLVSVEISNRGSPADKSFKEIKLKTISSGSKMEDFKLLQLHTTGKFLHVNLESLICSKYIMMTSNLLIPIFRTQGIICLNVARDLRRRVKYIKIILMIFQNQFYWGFTDVLKKPIPLLPRNNKMHMKALL